MPKSQHIKTGLYLEVGNTALSGVAQWAGHCPAHGKLLVQFPGRTQAQVASQVLVWGHVRGNQSRFLSHHRSFSFPFPLSKNK